MSVGTVHPRVSALLPVHNCAQHVRASIDSILAQDYQDFEIVVIDDGSTDGSSEIVSSYSDPRVKVIRNDSNLGLPRSLNRGAEEAVGQYLARQDADDLSSKDRFKLQVEMLDNNPRIGIAGSSWEWMDIYGDTYSVSYPDPGVDGLERVLINGGVPVPHGAMMVRRETFSDLHGYDNRFWFSQDYDFWLRVMNTEWQIGIVEKPLYRLRIGPTYTPYKERCQRRYTEIALSQYHSRQRLEFEDVPTQVRTEDPASQREIPNAEAVYWSEIGNAALSSMQDQSVARMYYRRSLERHKSIMAFAALLVTFAPRWLARSCIQTWRFAKQLVFGRRSQ
jgi:glycosyltransferase involved in cell wall biosynthesis